MRNPISWLISLVIVLISQTACTDKLHEYQKSNVNIQINENMAMVGNAFETVFNAEENPKVSKNIAKQIAVMDYTPDDESFAIFINSLKDSTNLANQSAEFKNMFLKDLDEYHTVWQTNLNTLKNWQRKLQTFCDKHISETYIRKIHNLFKSRLPTTELSVYLVPLTHDHSATSFYLGKNLIFLQLMPSNVVDHIGVILHEYIHINYASMNPMIYKTMEKIFKDNDAEVIQNYMNEALAVAGGNILTKLHFENPPDKANFACDYIDKFGTALTPLLKSYMDDGKSLDSEFFEHAISIFNEHFPDYQSNIKYWLIDIRILSSENNEKRMGNINCELRRLFEGKVWCASIQWFGLNNSIVSRESTNLVLLKSNENYKDLHIHNNELIVRHTDNSALQVVIKTDDLKVLRQGIKLLLQMDISKDFRIRIQ